MRMAHCKQDDLKDLKDMIQQLRETEGLKEKSYGCFYHKGKVG